MAGRHVALIRGINVGKAKRVAMADLRAVVEGLGYTDVRTLLNSGNVVFTGAPGKDIASRLQEALAAHTGVSAKVIVLSAAELAEVMAENPLLDVAEDPKRLLVTILNKPEDRKRIEPLTKQDWAPDVLALGRRAVYQWCAGGILKSPLAVPLGKAVGDTGTARNWATLTKIKALIDEA